MKPIHLIFTFIVLTMFSCTKEETTSIDLSGEWNFQMDPENIGQSNKWFENQLEETIQLPGSMVENDKGYEITLETDWTGGVKNEQWHKDPNYAPYHDDNNIRFPFWLQPNKKYTGAAWYQREVELPKKWLNKAVWLNLERPHWETNVWINGIKVGRQNALATPHCFDISEYIVAGKNNITICVDNRTKDIDVGLNSHSISDHTQSNWNGIVGEISLKTSDKVYFDDIRIFPNLGNKSVDIKAYINNRNNETVKVNIEVESEHKKTEEETAEAFYDFDIEPGENIVKMNYMLGEDALLWDEFEPNVYELLLEMRYDSGEDVKRVDFGLRDFTVKNNKLLINNRQVYLRGTLECAIFPKTGYPPTGVDEWKKVYTAIQAHGLNHIRFHSWCPPKAAFTAADELGVYLQVECSSWANQSTRLGSGLPIDQYIRDESERIVKEYGNHPSFVMMAYGNEPGGTDQTSYLKEFVSYWKAKDNRRIYTSGAGWPLIEENDFHCTHRNVRIQGWGEGLRSIINNQPPRSDYDWTDGIKELKSPLVSHEIGQWCVYPNFKEIEKYTGPLKAKNFELFRESLTANHMGDLANDFLMASGKLQALCYKADIEAALRTPGFGGFQLLDLHDFPGQGTALVGVLDPFWEEKGYITPEEYKRFCNTTVPLLRLKKRIFHEGETLNALVEVAHFGNKTLNENPKWQIKNKQEIIAEGSLGQQDISIGNAIKLGEIDHTFQKKNKARKLNIEVKIGDFSNSWDIWVYPEEPDVKAGDIQVVKQLNASAVKHLENGGKVLLMLGKGKVSPDMGGDIGVGFSSIFWNTAWTDGQKPHTLGILCDPVHPALEMFPTEYHSNWQWWDAMSHCDAIMLNNFPKELKPIVRIIDDWVSNRRLALLFEAKVGKGKIFISGADLEANPSDRPEAAQLKASLLNYMNSDLFQPEVDLDIMQIKSIIK